MNKLTLRLKEQPTVPLEAEVLSPDTFAELSNEEIRSKTVYHGKRQCRLDDFFDVDGERSDDVEIHGDLHRVRWIGREMSRGRITVHGSVGMHLGAYMKGGEIEVHGNASDWIGAEMRNGLIRVHGNGGGQIGAGYRGSLKGMRGGTIIVDGSAGLEVGMRMRRGMVVLGGPAKDFTGLQMKGGTIVLLAGAEIRTGAWMMRGTIISLKPIQMMPTFSYACRYTPDVLRVYSRRLKELGVSLPYAPQDGAYKLYSGDASVPGKGEILVWDALSA
ncbi:MAG TPA: formylmethanofuran dehydrogenase subunit C [Pirellulaceae bacterium]|nr:formylmethanofuran dehydrogenase subunit C [Pirellulaceae bacterium]